MPSADHALRFDTEASGEARLREALAPHRIAQEPCELQRDVLGRQLAVGLDTPLEVRGCEPFASDTLECRAEIFQPAGGEGRTRRGRVAAESLEQPGTTLVDEVERVSQVQPGD